MTAATMLAVLVTAASGAKDDVDLVSRGLQGAAGDAGSLFASISADGRYVAFQSDAANLSAEDDNGVTDVFVRDVHMGTTTHVSRATGAAGAIADAESSRPSISADGRYVAFQSSAGNLSAADGNGFADVYVRDLHTGQTTYVSRAADGTDADAGSFNPAISADGRHVGFESGADDLSDQDDDSVSNVYVHDLETGATSHVSRATDGSAAGGSSGDPSISDDGRRVAFHSHADNLSDEDDDTVTNVYVRDLESGTTTHVSRATDNSPGADDSFGPSISADGRHVAFESNADNLVDDAGAGFTNVFVRDLQDGETTHVSRATSEAPANGASGAPSISSDGRWVAFQSSAGNLSGVDTNGAIDVFVRDSLDGTTTLVSRVDGASGPVAEAGSFNPAISANGIFVAFHSEADNLSGDDVDTVGGDADVFRRDVLGAAPVNLAAPEISGGPAIGDLLACSPGSWANDPATFAFQWLRDGINIPGAIAAVYTITPGDAERALRCRVTATSIPGGSVPALSGPVVAAAAPVLPAVPPPAAAPPAAPPPAASPVAPAAPAPPAAGPPAPTAVPSRATRLRLRARSRLSARQRQRVRVRYTLNARGRVRLEVRRGRRRVATLNRNARRGRNTITWNGRVTARRSRGRRGRTLVAPRGRYTIVLTARGRDSQVARDTIRLTLRAARRPSRR
ncbi:MAG: hypothetical protein WD844_10020 [Thermoleophilaceae bacterium]